MNFVGSSQWGLYSAMSCMLTAKPFAFAAFTNFSAQAPVYM